MSLVTGSLPPGAQTLCAAVGGVNRRPSCPAGSWRLAGSCGAMGGLGGEGGANRLLLAAPAPGVHAVGCSSAGECIVLGKVLLAGGTGLVGSRILERLRAGRWAVTAVGRRAAEGASENIVADFAALPPLPGADAAICCLGTTIAAAGSREAFRSVDHDAVLAFAQAARAVGASRFVVVTAVGADPGGAAFYSRVKGEVEQALVAVGFVRLDILQPGLLLGPRADRRPLESIMQRVVPVLNPLLLGGLDRYGAIDADVVAAAAVALLGYSDAGVFRHDNRALRRIAG